MARTTPLRGWSYPDFEENPYDTTIVNFFEEQDADVHRLVTAIRNVKDFGATGDGTTDDTSAIQSAINSAGTGTGYSIGALVYFPAGRYRITSALTIDRQVTLAGAGTMSEIWQATLTVPILSITAISSTGTTAPDPGHSRQVTVRDLALCYGGWATAGACIYVDPGATNMTFGCRFLNLDLYAGYDGIHFERGAYWIIDNCFISGIQRYSIYVRNATSPSSGDSRISNCLFWDTSAAGNLVQAHIYLRSAGGLQITNCKNLWGNYGVVAAIDEPTSTSTLLISNCSWTGILGGVKLGTVSGAFVTTTITGCTFDSEYAGAFGALDISGSFQMTTISGNNFYLSQNDATGVAIGEGVTGMTVSANSFSAFTGTGLTAISIAAGVTDVTISGNGYHGTFASRLTSLASPSEVQTYDLPRRRFLGALVANSAVIANTTANTAFNKSVTIPANTLQVGSVIRVEYRLRVTAMAGTPGTLAVITFFPANMLGFSDFSLLASADSEVYGFASATIRSLGASGTYMPGPGGLGTTAVNLWRASTTFSPTTALAIDTTINQAVGIYITFSVANVANTATLQALNVWLDNPEATVS